MVGRARSQPADRAGVHGMVVHQHGAAGDGLDHRHPMAGGERRQHRLRPAVAHAAAGDQQRLPRRPQQGRRRLELKQIRPRPRDAMHAPLEEPLRIVERLRLHVLAQAEEGRPAIGRIEQHAQRLGQGLQQLLGTDDPVPVARHRLERVVDAESRIAPVLDLLQHRIGQPRHIVVARQQQHRQPVGVRHAGRGHHVGRPRPDRARRHHDLAARLGLGEADRRQRHRLLVLAAPGRQLVLDRLQGLAQAGDVAVAEDREHAGKQRHLGPVELGALRHQPAHQRLRHGETDGGHGWPPCRPFGRGSLASGGARVKTAAQAGNSARRPRLSAARANTRSRVTRISAWWLRVIATCSASPARRPRSNRSRKPAASRKSLWVGTS